MIDYRAAYEAVSQRDAVGTRSATWPSVPAGQIGSGVCGAAAAPIDQGELPLVTPTVAVEQHFERLLRCGAGSQERQADGSVSWVSEPLCRDDPDVGLAIGDGTPDPGSLD
jgi:hypothetical protein